MAKWGGEKDDKWAERGEGGGRRRVDDREGTQLGRVEVIQRAARRRDRETGAFCVVALSREGDRKHARRSEGIGENGR